MVQGHRVTVGIFLLVGLFAHGLSEQLSESERRSAFIGYSEGAIPEPVVRSVPKRHNSRREGPLEGSWKWASKEYLASEQLKNRTEPILLSKEPCVLLLPNFVDPKSARQMMKMAEPRLRSQRFRDQPDTRTSWGAVLWGNERVSGEAVSKSEQLVRAARSDGLEVKRYQVGEKYNSHHDYFSSPQSQMKDDRIATFLIYLQSAEEGGETIFPWAGGTEQIDPRTGWPYRPLDYNTECEPQTTPPGAVKVMVPTGYAVLFYNAKKNGESDPYSQHGSCPVKRGEKWTATVWTRGADRFDPNDRWKTADVLAMCDP
mmetsp:Transcript_46510/g.88799  ORF Transcript_46510/g.88799 Transcript_46510/m.88799 type:complete len:315 (+) Transcript_46510:176-1120(+)